MPGRPPKQAAIAAPAVVASPRRITFTIEGRVPERQSGQRAFRDTSTGTYLARMGGFAPANRTEQYRLLVSRVAVLRARLWKRNVYDLPGDNFVQESVAGACCQVMMLDQFDDPSADAFVAKFVWDDEEELDSPSPEHVACAGALSEFSAKANTSERQPSDLGEPPPGL